MARPRLGDEERRTRRGWACGSQRPRRRNCGSGRRRGLGQQVRIAAEPRELNRIGVNLNQMARAFNSGDVSSAAGTRCCGSN